MLLAECHTGTSTHRKYFVQSLKNCRSTYVQIAEGTDFCWESNPGIVTGSPAHYTLSYDFLFRPELSYSPEHVCFCFVVIHIVFNKCCCCFNVYIMYPIKTHAFVVVHRHTILPSLCLLFRLMCRL